MSLNLQIQAHTASLPNIVVNCSCPIQDEPTATTAIQALVNALQTAGLTIDNTTANFITAPSPIAVTVGSVV